MEQLRLVGVHDDGEHLIVETPGSTRYRVKIDQQLRQAVQHARRKTPARGRGGAAFGPREIQARFRAGASVDDVVAESGWEAERVRRYEWPILAERSHMVAAACRVKVSGTNPTHDGYRSVFEGEPKTLEETVDERAGQLGVDRRSLDWDAWLREDQLWNLRLSFTVSDPAAGAPEAEGPALWSYNPASQTVRPENEWARALGEEPREAGPLGDSAPAVTAPAAAPSPAAQLRHLQYEASQADDLLDVLQARRGRRLGSDEDGDDRLAEVLGRGMGRVDQRPRPIDAPEDSPVFDRPIQPAASRVAEDQALQGDGIEIVDDSTSYVEETQEQQDDSREELDAAVARDDSASRDARAGRASAPHDGPRVTPAVPSPADEPGDGTHDDDLSRTEQTGTSRDHGVSADSPRAAEDTGTEDTATAGSARPEDSASDRDLTDAGSTEEDSSETDEKTPPPGPRGRTPRARRSSVPSWDDIVFGNRS